jgi:histidinol dehydrogenase
MAKKNMVRYVCSNCGNISLTWNGRCSACDMWGTYEKEEIDESGCEKPRSSDLMAVNIIDVRPPQRFTSGIPELDRVLGGGWVSGGEVGIDGLAGPSEVLIIADDSANPAWLAADIAAQSEHDPMAASTLLCTDEKIAAQTSNELSILLETLETAETIRRAWEVNGTLAICSLEEAINESNVRAPEHLQLCVRAPEKVLDKCMAYGAAFIGSTTPVPFGDYIGGTNHTLPTNRRARFAGGLWTGTFLRPLTSLCIDSKGAASLAEDGINLAQMEGLKAHSLAMALRRNLS